MSNLQNLINALCPEGVTYKKIGEIAEVGTGSSNGNEAIEDGVYPFFVRSHTVKAKDDYVYDEEAILFPREGGIGEIFHYINGKYALHQRVYRIHFITDDVNVKFAYYYMQAQFKTFIMKKAVSATVTSIRKPMVEDFLLPLPPLQVQCEIVKILDSFTELIILPPPLVEVLKKYKETVESIWMFPSPVKEGDEPRDPQSLYHRTQLLLERAGCKRVRFHDLRHTFATMSLESGMDVKTLSAMIGHISSATTLDIYSHITTEMQVNAARKIDNSYGRDYEVYEEEAKVVEEPKPVIKPFDPYKGKIRKSGTGGIYELNDHLYEGRYTPTNANGKRESHNVYGKTREECQEKLNAMYVEVRARINAEKEAMRRATKIAN